MPRRAGYGEAPQIAVAVRLSASDGHGRGRGFAVALQRRQRSASVPRSDRRALQFDSAILRAAQP
jgi:hypothetical protein